MGQEEEVGRHPVLVNPVHPGYSQGAVGPGELPQTSLHFWKQDAAYPIVNTAVSGLFPLLGQVLSLSLLKGKRNCVRPDQKQGHTWNFHCKFGRDRGNGAGLPTES